MPHVTIIGGGIAGLATAYYLQKKSRENGIPFSYSLIESAPRLGGKIVTDQVGDFIIEGGPDSFITQKPWATQLCRELGLADRLIPTNDERRNIYVLSKGKLVPFPGGYRLTVPTEFVPFALSPLISPLGKLRMGLDLVIPPRREQGDESLADFIRRRLGAEALDKIAGPVMAGIYVADPERLSLLSTFPMFAEMEQKYGSLIKAMRVSKKSTASHSANNGSGPRSPVPGQPLAMFTSLRGGMQELVEALTAQLQGDLQLGSRVIGLRRLSPGFEVTLDSSGTLQTDAVVMAAPAFIAAGLLEPLEPRLAALLRQIRYVSTATVSLGYRRTDLPTDLNGFGFMVPKSENRQILACTWSSTKFDHRAPANGALLRLFVGGDTKEHLVETLADEELFALAQAELRAIMGITAPPVAQRVFRWPKGNAQYDVGHLDRVAEMEQLAAAIPGLYLAGSAFRGIGLPDCIKSALTTVEGLMLQVKTFER
ncbi:MAG: protoporphyrinogen oxidase [Anaerolineae bacterium]|nr:protoporphyrinogen oxidase [Anaerolineales bacterium]MCQ3976795.1 protoporphyrinogen oxidase [Anaerolineae bacterium]